MGIVPGVVAGGALLDIVADGALLGIVADGALNGWVPDGADAVGGKFRATDCRVGDVDGDEPGEGELVAWDESEDAEMGTVENLGGLARPRTGGSGCTFTFTFMGGGWGGGLDLTGLGVRGRKLGGCWVLVAGWILDWMRGAAGVVGGSGRERVGDWDLVGVRGWGSDRDRLAGSGGRGRRWVGWGAEGVE